ncbi:MAG: ubiquinol oxidase subunit II [Oceanospirillaceae bacterium]|nr:ubiquinol oxidase subunit II [Oceanospirillaceae bacterium]|tara:strand:- start:11341 stop:12315 length:975 start_codon:yes stop_codon:yes gene_type:complete
MIKKRAPRALGFIFIASLLLSGCSGGILDPKGQVGVDEKNLILFSTVLMLLVVIPVIFMTIYFAWKYRAGHNQAVYDPKWDHSTRIELVVWLIPCILIVILGAVTWVTTHDLDPYKPLEGKGDHLEIDVVSLNWKWLFIYPDQGIATVNELVIPAGVPVKFRLTSESVMNSFFIPQLGSQIYTMAAMETKLHLIADEPGTYDGFSANYSGAGFSGMKFKTIATPTQQDFDAWVGLVRSSHQTLNDRSYQSLTVPTEDDPVSYYANVDDGLFDRIVMKYMRHHGHTPMTDQTMSAHMHKTSTDAPEMPAMAAPQETLAASSGTEE